MEIAKIRKMNLWVNLVVLTLIYYFIWMNQRMLVFVLLALWVIGMLVLRLRYKYKIKDEFKAYRLLVIIPMILMNLYFTSHETIYLVGSYILVIALVVWDHYYNSKKVVNKEIYKKII